MESVERLLATYKKKTISISELEQLTKAKLHTYEAFSSVILELEEKGILVMIKAKGRTTRNPSLAVQYRINKNLLKESHHLELQHYRSHLHPSVNLDDYYGKDPAIWKHELPFLIKIDNYLKQYSFPTDEVPAPERSYELVGDEKWIVEKGGKELLERINLFHKLQIISVSEPLMFAINPLKMNEKIQYHLIVENKTTYQGLLAALKETDFSTLIYGSGKTIISSIEQFSMQYPIYAEHHFFYFGDIDKEGISIWYSLNQKQSMNLATPFYEACLGKEAAVGKEYQRGQRKAIEHFLPSFSPEEQLKIQDILKNGQYYPQETLKTKELQQIWRETDWTSLIYKK